MVPDQERLSTKQMAPSGPGDSGARLLVSLGLDCSWQEPAVAVGPPALSTTSSRETVAPGDQCTATD